MYKRSERELPKELVEKALKHWFVKWYAFGCRLTSTERFETFEDAKAYLEQNLKNEISISVISFFICNTVENKEFQVFYNFSKPEDGLMIVEERKYI